MPQTSRGFFFVSPHKFRLLFVNVTSCMQTDMNIFAVEYEGKVENTGEI